LAQSHPLSDKLEIPDQVKLPQQISEVAGHTDEPKADHSAS
jgi:hypothetical protein